MAVTIPIIAMTANAFSEDIHDCLEAGMNAHVSKPIDMTVLEQTVRSSQKAWEILKKEPVCDTLIELY